MSIRAAYAAQGVIPYYETHGATYRNPHEAIIHECLDKVIVDWKVPLKNVLDLACGSGEVTTHIKAKKVVGVDPFTNEAYYTRTGQTALPYTFDDIANGALQDSYFDVIICSFALHLVEESRLPGICYALAQVSQQLIIITPNKKPTISCGWTLIDDFVHKRVHTRYYLKNE